MHYLKNKFVPTIEWQKNFLHGVRSIMQILSSSPYSLTGLLKGIGIRYHKFQGYSTFILIYLISFENTLGLEH
jgi:hypothetical protein